MGIDAKLQFEFQSDLCTGFWEDWTFDIVFSAHHISDFDANKNGSFEPDEHGLVPRQGAGAFVTASFLYGMLHAAEPGHRKNVIFYLFPGRKSPV